MKHLFDMTNRFRILKGGKISLVVGAMMIGSFINVSNAAEKKIETHLTAEQVFDNNENDSFIVTKDGRIDSSPRAINIINGMGSDHKLENYGTLQVIGSSWSVINGNKYSSAKTIDVNSDLIDSSIYNSKDIIATITNTNIDSSDSISANSTGISLSKNVIGSSIKNSGKIEAKVTNTPIDSSVSNESDAYVVASGIDVGYSLNNSNIENNGEVITEVNASGNYKKSYADSIGIYLQGWDEESANFKSSIKNSGDIISSSITNGNNSSSEVRGIDIINNFDDSELNNSGNIKSSSITNGNNSYSDARGIYTRGSNNSTLTNSKDITVTSINNGKERDVYTAGLYMSGVNSSLTLTNSGNIKATSTSNGEDNRVRARGISLGENENSSIINSGNIIATGYVNKLSSKSHSIKGFDIDEFNNSSFTNEKEGNIKANLIVIDENSLGEAYGIYIKESIYANIINKGTIEAYKNNELDKDAYSLVIYDGITLRIPNNNPNKVTNTGVLKGNIYVEKELNNSGSIELPYNAYGNDDKAYVKNLINESNGKLRVGLKTDGTLKNTIYSQLNAQTAHFKDGSTINVNELKSSTNQKLLIGERLDYVVTASNSLTIDGKLNITDNSRLLDFVYETSNYDDTGEFINEQAGAIHLRVIEGSNIVDDTKSGGGNSNARAAANIIDSNPDMRSAFNDFSTDDEIAAAVASTVTLTPTSNVQAGTQVASMISGIVTQRQNVNISGGGLNSGDTMFSDKNFWFKPFGSIGSQNDKDGISGFDITTGGFGLGLDGEYKDNQKIGFGLFYTNANVEVNNQPQKSDIDMFTALVYGSVPVIDDKTNFLYQTGYTWQKTDSSRTLFTGDKATADYTSNTAFVDLKLTRDVQISDKFLLKPMVETTYRHFTNPSYKENGAGALNLHVDKFTSEDLILGIGTNAYYNITNDSKIVGNVNVGYDFKGNDQTITSSFAGAAGVKFDTKGIDNGRWSYQAGIGYELDINDRNNIHVGYEYQGQGKDFSNNIISAKYVLKF